MPRLKVAEVLELAVLAIGWSIAAPAWAAIAHSGSTVIAAAPNAITYVGKAGLGTLRIDNGSSLADDKSYIGYNRGATGAATVSGAASSWVTRICYVGDAGTGELTVDAGGLVSSLSARLGVSSGSIGAATVSGAGSAWINTTEFTIGSYGSGSLMIRDGGTLAVHYAGMGLDAGATATATVRGEGSAWTCSGDMYVSYRGSSSLSVEDGAEVFSVNSCIARDAGSAGSVVVRGAGSFWRSSGELYASNSGSSSLTVADGGRVTAKAIYASLSDLHGNGTIEANGAVLDASLVFDGAKTTACAFGSGGTLNLATDGQAVLGVGHKDIGDLRIVGGAAVASKGSYLGYREGSSGSALVSGAGSKWTHNGYEGDLYAGYFGSGRLDVDSGAELSSWRSYIGYAPSSTGIVTISGTGSKWTSVGTLHVGYNGLGTLTIKDGGQVRSGMCVLGRTISRGGTVVVTGAGSTLSGSEIAVIMGSLAVADNARITTGRLNVVENAFVRFHVTGDGMLVAQGVLDVFNRGTISFYADASLPSGVYRPISPSAAGGIAWSGTGSYLAFGGVWDDTDKTFVVSEPTTLIAGEENTVTTGERFLFWDPQSGRRAGISFGTITANVQVSAVPTGADELTRLAVLLEEGHGVLQAWNFTAESNPGEAMISFDVGVGAKGLSIWHFSNGDWLPCTPTLWTYDAAGRASFTVSSFGGYAATAAVPEPNATPVVTGIAMTLLGRRRRRERPASRISTAGSARALRCSFSGCFSFSGLAGSSLLTRNTPYCCPTDPAACSAFQ